jgi:hypothetical protein
MAEDTENYFPGTYEKTRFRLGRMTLEERRRLANQTQGFLDDKLELNGYANTPVSKFLEEHGHKPDIKSGYLNCR